MSSCRGGDRAVVLLAPPSGVTAEDTRGRNPSPPPQCVEIPNASHLPVWLGWYFRNLVNHEQRPVRSEGEKQTDHRCPAEEARAACVPPNRCVLRGNHMTDATKSTST